MGDLRLRTAFCCLLHEGQRAYRQTNDKRGAIPLLTVNRNLSPVHIDDILHDSRTQSCTTGFPAYKAIREETVTYFRRHTVSRILDGKFDEIIVSTVTSVNRD